jgi:hypothetical protein
MVKAVIDQVNELVEKDKEPAAVEQEVSKYHNYHESHESHMKVSCLLTIILGSASRISNFVPSTKGAITPPAAVSYLRDNVADWLIELLYLLSELRCPTPKRRKLCSDHTKWSCARSQRNFSPSPEFASFEKGTAFSLSPRIERQHFWSSTR